MSPVHFSSSPRALLFIHLLLLLLCLIASSLPLLMLLTLAMLVALYLVGDLRHYYRSYLLVAGFIVLGALPLLVERIDCYDAGLTLAWGLGISPRSFRLALQVIFRACACSLVVRHLLVCLPFYRLCQVLRSLGTPRLLLDLIELSYRYIHTLTEQSRHIYEAQVLRLGYATPRAKYRDTGTLIAQTFVLAHSEAEEMYRGLESRQFYEKDGAVGGEQLSLSDPSRQGEDNLAMGQEISLRNISYRYPDSQSFALEGLSLSIGQGERIVLLGANGAGKSTLMHILSGLRRETAGEIWYAGRCLGGSRQDLRTQRQAIALVMQNANHQLFCPSVEDEIAFGLRNSGLSDAEVSERVETIIQAYELEELRHKPPHQLSEGQKKWLSLAAVMALEPKYILMDEPTACLDCYYTERIMALVDRLCRQGCSVLLSTHDMNLAYAWAERALVLDGGKLLYDGQVDRLFEDSHLLEQAKLKRPYGYRSQGSCVSATDADYRLGLFHNINTLTTLIVGGGRGAERKAKTLSQVGVKWYLLSPELTPEIERLTQMGCGVWCKGCYPSAEFERLLTNSRMLVAATGNAEVDRVLCHRAIASGLLASALSDPLIGNIQFAAQGEYAGLHLAVHSRYRLPELTQEIRSLVLQSLSALDEEELGRLAKLRLDTNDNHYIQERDKILSKIKNDWSIKR